MCDRVTLPDDLSSLKALLGIRRDRLGIYKPRSDVGPGRLVPTVTSRGGCRTLEWMRWGIIPPWAQDTKISYRSFSVATDQVAKRVAFRNAWNTGRRCLVVADGLYEAREAKKRPFELALDNGQPMLIAGIWDEWRRRGHAAVRSCAIITIAPDPLAGPPHARLPVIFEADDWQAWLSEEPIDDPAAVLRPFVAGHMILWPFGKPAARAPKRLGVPAAASAL